MFWLTSDREDDTRMEEAKNDLIKADRSKKTLHSCASKWPKLEDYVKNWIIDHRKNGTAVSTKMILTFTRRDLNSYSQPSRTTLFSLGI